MSNTGETRKCVVCGKERYFYSSQVKRGCGQYCSMECRKKGESKRCIVCGKDRRFRPSEIKMGYGKYCSRECKWKAEGDARKKCLVCGKELDKTMGCQNGKYCSYECFGKSIRTRRRVVCSYCGKEFERKPYQLNRSKKVFCSKACHDEDQRKGRKEYVCHTCGKTITRRGRRRYQYCSSKCLMSDPIVILRLAEQHRKQLYKNGPNKLELAGRAILLGMGIDFEEQVLLFERFTVDVFVKKHNLVIQWDGDYWHGNPKAYREFAEFQIANMKKDKACNAYLRKCGMKVVRFWERDVKGSPEWVSSETKRIIDAG